MIERIGTEEIAYAWTEYQKIYRNAFEKGLKKPVSYVHADNLQMTEYLANLMGKISTKILENPDCKNKIETGWAVLWFDTSDDKYRDLEEQKAAIEDLEQKLEQLSKARFKRVIVCFGITTEGFSKPLAEYQYGENELRYVWAECPEGSNGRFCYEIESVCHRILKKNDLSIQVLRVLHPVHKIFNNFCSRTMQEWISETEKSGVIQLSGGNHKIYRSGMRTILRSILLLFLDGKKGSVYQIYSIKMTDDYLKFRLYERLKQGGLSVHLQEGASEPNEETGISPYLIQSLRWKQNLEDSRKVTELLDPFIQAELFDFDTECCLRDAYCGQLDRIKNLEMKLIREIDRICKKYHIKYFLAGGSLLGAVRHHGFIPWDDDLDVCMLREEFEKFREIAPGELQDDFAYQSFRTDPNSHYTFDKVRLKNTFFSTQFSNRFSMENGIFIDLLVYDKTSNNPKQQQRHINRVVNKTTWMNILWVNEARHNIHYIASKLFLPFLRLIPFKWYHHNFERTLRKYEKMSTSEYLIDSVGQNITRGAFPSSWFDEIVEMPFEDMILPVPAGYKEYLTHWYGKNYMSYPPLASQFSGHILARIDMGEYAQKDYAGEYKADLRGDLYAE